MANRSSFERRNSDPSFFFLDQIERGVVVIPKSVHKNRILENFDVFDFQMSAEDVAAIDGLNTNLRFLDWLKGCPGYSFGIEF